MNNSNKQNFWTIALVAGLIIMALVVWTRNNNPTETTPKPTIQTKTVQTGQIKPDITTTLQTSTMKTTPTAATKLPMRTPSSFI